MWLILALALTTAHAEEENAELAKQVQTKHVAAKVLQPQAKTVRSTPEITDLEATGESTMLTVKEVNAQMKPMRALLEKGLAQKQWYTASSDTQAPTEEMDNRMAAAFPLLQQATFAKTSEPVAHKRAYGEEDWVHKRQAMSNWKLLTDASGTITHAIRGQQDIHYGRGTSTADIEIVVAFADGTPTQLYRRVRYGDYISSETLYELSFEKGALASLDTTELHSPGREHAEATRQTLVPKA